MIAFWLPFCEVLIICGALGVVSWLAYDRKGRQAAHEQELRDIDEWLDAMWPIRRK